MYIYMTSINSDVHTQAFGGGGGDGGGAGEGDVLPSAQTRKQHLRLQNNTSEMIISKVRVRIRCQHTNE